MYFSANTNQRFYILKQRFPDGRPMQVTSGPGEEEGLAVTPDASAVFTSVGTRRVSRRSLLVGAGGFTGGWLMMSVPSGPRVSAADGQGAAPPPPQGSRILLKGGAVITLDPALGDFDVGDVLIDGSRIAAVGPDLEAGSGVAIVDASRMIVMPGFVDTHRHMWQGALRNILPDGLLSDYVRVILGARVHYRPEDVHIGTLASALGALDAGVTTVLDWSHIGNSPAHTDAAIAGLREAGIRAVYGFGGGAPGPDNRFPDDIRRLRTEHFASEDGLLTLALAGGLDAAQWALARDVGARISVHVNGTGQLLPLASALGPDVTCIHCTQLLDEEWRLLAKTGASVSIAAPIEMQMGHGIPPIQQALDHGIRPSLSVDVETQMAGDMFRQMLAIFTLQRMQILARQRAKEADLPPLLTVREVVGMATVQGARDNGLEGRTGSLTPGKDADVILLDRDRINVMPVNDPYGALVLGMDTSNVDTVFVAGRARKWRGALVDVDLDAIRRRLHASRSRLRAAGVV
jgi:5-methylthioadenosine/S-adenosylhomocysteine deaminase